MAFLLIAVLALAYLALWGYAVYKSPNILVAMTVFLAFLLLPTADAVYGRIRLKHLCETEGGMKIFRTVEGVEGFYAGNTRPAPEWITKYGYAYVEGQGLDGKSMRLSNSAAGQLVEERNVDIRSQYQLIHSGGSLNGGFVTDEYIVLDKSTKTVLAKNQNIGFRGGWVERVVGSISDAGGGSAGSCQEGANWVSPTMIIQKTLIPTKKF